MHYVGMSTYQFLPYMYTCILKPFEDSEPTGLKVDIVRKDVVSRRLEPRFGECSRVLARVEL